MIGVTSLNNEDRVLKNDENHGWSRVNSAKALNAASVKKIRRGS
ncbi:hypothetical protein AB28_0087 [Raoultella ornithinolytica 2-156-04_S1_C2]|nr:hypothetical protein AB00_0085 [Raoultella ornithinolytica 2-156-04_S1_C1]KDX16552.1 hypothetical protein AB28_0087 [Raoultella ornithinolytica 2-156-04_S1_C2]